MIVRFSEDPSPPCGTISIGMYESPALAAGLPGIFNLRPYEKLVEVVFTPQGFYGVFEYVKKPTPPTSTRVSNQADTDVVNDR